MTTWKASIVAIPLSLLFATAAAHAQAPAPTARASGSDAASKPQPEKTGDATTAAKPTDEKKEKKAKKE